MKVRYKKNGILHSYESECLCPVPRKPPPVLTGPFQRGEGCPYPGHGFICWDRSGEKCLRTEVARIMERDRFVGFAGQLSRGHCGNVAVNADKGG